MPSTVQSPNSSKQAPKSPSRILAGAEQQWLFTETELSMTPSIADGMPLQTERSLRTKGLNFILSVGISLKIPQMTLCTASVFFNRFLTRHSLQKTPTNSKPLHHYQVAATALLLATKTDESIRRMKDIIIACCRVAQKNPALIIDEQNKDYWKWRDTLLFNEDVLLEALCFDLTVESPYKLLYEMLRKLGVEGNKPLRNAAWAFLCDSLMTTLCLLQGSRTIAAAGLWCGARFSGTALAGDSISFGSSEGDASPAANGTSASTNANGAFTPSATNGANGEGGAAGEIPWWDVVHVRLHDVKKACNYMADLYEHSAAVRERDSQNQDGRTPAGTANGTPNPNDGFSSQYGSQLQSQAAENIYEGLRSELSDDEEDGEVLDDEGELEEGEAATGGEAGEIGEDKVAAETEKVTREEDRKLDAKAADGVASERRGVKRRYDGADDDAG